LEGAAHYYLKQVQGDKEVVNEALSAWDAPDDAIESEKQVDLDFWVHPDNWQAVLLLMNVQSCWRKGKKGVFLGLRYTDVKVVIDFRFKDVVGIFEQLQFLEREILGGQ